MDPNSEVVERASVGLVLLAIAAIAGVALSFVVPEAGPSRLPWLAVLLGSILGFLILARLVRMSK